MKYIDDLNTEFPIFKYHYYSDDQMLSISIGYRYLDNAGVRCLVHETYDIYEVNCDDYALILLTGQISRSDFDDLNSWKRVVFNDDTGEEINSYEITGKRIVYARHR